MPTMFIRPALAPSKYFSNCVFLCIRTLNNVDNTEPRKDTVRKRSKKNGKLYLLCFDSVRRHTQYWNKWILDDCWIDIINERFDIPTHLKFASSDLNRAIGRDQRFNGIDTVGESNVNGVYNKASYFERVGAKHVRLTAYYVTSSMKLP